MKIVHVVAGIEANNGAAVTATSLAREEVKLGHEVSLVTTKDNRKISNVNTEGITLYSYQRSLGGLACFSLKMLLGLRKIIQGADLVRTHCEWTFPVWWAVQCAKQCGAKVVMRPAGSYDPVRLAHSRWKKKMAAGIERWCLRHATAVHATCDNEAEWVKVYEPKVKKVFVVPNGVSVPSRETTPSNQEPIGRLRLLYLGRRHPLKGLDLLEKAVAGMDEGSRPELRIESSIFGEEKEAAFKWCDALILPSRSENFGLVVAEALARGKPVITTKGTPWNRVVEHGCGWWVDVTAEALRDAIMECMNMPRSELAKMGERGRVWMAQEYDWGMIAKRVLENCCAE